MLRYLETFFRNRWLISIPALILLCSGASLVLMVQPQFHASTTIWTEQLAYLDLPRPANRWLTPAQVQGNRLSELRRIYSFTRSIVDRTPIGLNGSEGDKLKLVDQITNELRIRELGENSLRISFQHTDPAVATAVLQITIEEYSRVMAERAHLQVNEAKDFYQQQIRDYETRVVPETAKAVTDYLASHPELRDDPALASTDPDFTLLQQQADTARDELERNRGRLAEILSQGDAVSRNQLVAFRIMDQPAVTNSGEIGKKTLLLYAGVGTALAGAYAVLYVLLATELDRTMRNSTDVRRRLGLEVLEVVPEYVQHSSARQRKWSRRKAVSGPVPTTSMGNAP